MLLLAWEMGGLRTLRHQLNRLLEAWGEDGFSAEHVEFKGSWAGGGCEECTSGTHEPVQEAPPTQPVLPELPICPSKTFLFPSSKTG